MHLVKNEQAEIDYFASVHHTVYGIVSWNDVFVDIVPSILGSTVKAMMLVLQGQQNVV